MKSIIIFITVLCFSFTLRAQVLNIYTEEFPPYQIRLSPKNVTGISTTLVKELLAEVNIPYKIHVLPWYRSYHNALKEKNSLLYSVARTKEREDIFEWIMPLCDINVSFFWKKDNHKISISSVNDAKKYVVSVASGQPSELYLKNHGFSTDENLVILASHEQGLGLLSKGRVDVIFAADLFIQNLARGEFFNKLELESFTIKALSKKLYLTANKSSEPSLIKSLKRSAKLQMNKSRKDKVCSEISDSQI